MSGTTSRRDQDREGARPQKGPEGVGVSVETAMITALMRGPRPRRLGPVVSSVVFGGRSVEHLRRAPVQLIDVTLFPVMMTLMFTYLLGGAISGSTGEYLQFLLPGMMVFSVVLSTAATGVRLNTDLERAIFDRFRTLGVWRPAPLVGLLMGDVLRYALAALFILGSGLVLGFRPEGGFWGVVAGVGLLVGFGFCLSWVWTMLGLVLRSSASVSALSTLLFPLVFLSNVFVPAQTLPRWLEVVVQLNPVTHLVQVVRELMAGQGAGASLLWVVVCGGALLVVFGVWTMRLYNRR